MAAPILPPVLCSITHGTLSSTTTLVSDEVPGYQNHLYIAQIVTGAAGGAPAVSSISGMGLTWTLVKAQCGGRGTLRCEVWQAIGNAVTGAVTATLASAPTESDINVTRWSGVPKQDAIGASSSYNTNGSGGACSGGVDSDDVTGALTTTANNSVILTAAAHDVGSAYTATGGWVSVAINNVGDTYVATSTESKMVATAGATTVGASNNLDAANDWALVAIEIFGDQQASGAAYADVARIVWRDTSHGKTVVDKWISCSVQHDKHIGTAQLVTSLDATWAAAKIDPAADLIGSWVTIYYRDMTTPLFHGALVKAEYGYAYGTRAAALTFESMFGHIWRRCIAVTPNNDQFIAAATTYKADIYGQRVMNDALGVALLSGGLWGSAVGGGFTVDRGDATQFGGWTATVAALHGAALSANDVLIDQQSGGNTLDLLIDIGDRGDIAYTTTETGTPGTFEFDTTATFARTDVSATVVLSDQHGTLSGFKRTVDYTTTRNTWQIKGDGDGTTQANTWYQDGSASPIGRFEDTVTFPAITTTASKEAYRDRMFALHADATVTIEVELIEQGGALFNDTFGLRDTVRVHSALFGYAATHTVVGYKLDLPSTGVGRVSLTLNQHPRRLATDTRDWAEGPGGRGGGGIGRMKGG